ncbi:MAG TPA: hypothetical protein VMR74_07105 [Gammaproteobacteria bacterium]|nr:hypothetical protein [Gammaproteobacteria bacterium]
MHRISTDGGAFPLWSLDGRQLFYEVSGPQGFSLMAVDVEATPAFTRGRPRLLFEGPYVGCVPVRCYDASPTGDRIVAVREGEPELEPVTSINIVVNWLAELEQRVPVP